MSSIIKKIYKEPNYSLYLLMKLFARQISDERFIRWKYRLKMHQSLHLDPPKTFNEKLQWLKLHDQHPEYSQFVDKYEVKKYVAQIIGEQHIIPTLALFNSVEEIDFAKLPLQFVLKCTHNSGGVIICKDKTTFDKEAARKLVFRWMKTNPYWETREYPYKNVKPRIIIEKYMEDESGYELKDYKFFCFNGKALYVQIDFGRFTEHKRNIYSRDWTPLNFSIEYPSDYNHSFDKPQNYEEMLDIAESLSANLCHARIDLYNVNGSIFFGEITFFHGSGLETFTPETWNQTFGDKIILPEKE